MSQYGYGQMPQQMPGQMGNPGGYGMPMQPQYDNRHQEYINRMQQQLDEFKQKYATPAPQQMQQPVQQQQFQQPMQPQQVTQALISVASIDEAQNYPPDLTGQKQWFVNGDQIYSKQFNVKTAGLEFHKYAVNDEPDAEEPPADNAKPVEVEQPKPDELDPLKAKIAALEKKQKELEEKLNAEPVAEPTNAPAKPVAEPNAAGNGDAKRGSKPKPNNRNGAPAKAGADADTVGADSK